MSTTNANVSNFSFDPSAKFLFKRTWALAIGAPYQTAAVQYSNLPFTPPKGPEQAASPLRIKFDIQKTPFGSSPNHSKFEIYNMSPENRARIKKGNVVLLRAGYMGALDTIFVGNISLLGLKTQRHGADIVTTFEAGDGESAIVNARLDKSYPPGTPLYRVLQDLAGAMAQVTTANPFGVNAGSAIGIPPETFGRGYTVSGECRRSLDKLLKPRGLRWHVQNGNLFIHPVGMTNGSSAVVVDQKHGMIGVPSQNSQYTEFISLLNPRLVPGGYVQLTSAESANLNGFYKIENSHFQGDTHDNKWQVSCQGVAQPSVKALPIASGNDFSGAVTSTA